MACRLFGDRIFVLFGLVAERIGDAAWHLREAEGMAEPETPAGTCGKAALYLDEADKMPAGPRQEKD